MRLPRWMRSARVLAGLSLAGLLLVLAVAGPLLAPNDPMAQDLSLPFAPVRLRTAVTMRG